MGFFGDRRKAKEQKKARRQWEQQPAPPNTGRYDIYATDPINGNDEVWPCYGASSDNGSSSSSDSSGGSAGCD